MQFGRDDLGGLLFPFAFPAVVTSLLLPAGPGPKGAELTMMSVTAAPSPLPPPGGAGGGGCCDKLGGGGCRLREPSSRSSMSEQDSECPAGFFIDSPAEGDGGEGVKAGNGEHVRPRDPIRTQEINYLLE